MRSLGVLSRLDALPFDIVPERFPAVSVTEVEPLTVSAADAVAEYY